MGDALVDVIATCDDDFLTRFGLPKGAMQLLDEAAGAGPLRCDGLGAGDERRLGRQQMAGRGDGWRTSPSSARSRRDQLGTIFTHDMRALGVRFDTPPLEEGPPTGRCLILVTPDGERTMNTCPGAATPAAAGSGRRGAVIARRSSISKAICSGPSCRARDAPAIDIAHAAERTVAFTLSKASACPAARSRCSS
jgi:sugar/nucleoside kinase (ribokinase family)